jgi:hypothetical protein
VIVNLDQQPPRRLVRRLSGVFAAEQRFQSTGFGDSPQSFLSESLVL